ncbi:hypothetical protein C8R43DRAFT_957232 [Mycena crocata]|nr:hypothetical protein C8R43DRAFT_957232 [Mycena crocata]
MPASAPPTLPAVAKQAIHFDASDEREYNPPLDDKTWYLLSPGMLSRNKDKLFEVMQHRFENLAPGSDISDYPCYAAPTFQSIVAFLPRCPHLKGQFEKKPSGEMKQTGPIYFVIHGINAVLFNRVSALRVAELYNAPLAVILAVATHDEAVEIAANYPPLNNVAVQDINGIKKQVCEALRETIGVPVAVV